MSLLSRFNRARCESSPKRISKFAALALCLCGTASLFAQISTPIRIDASQPFTQPGPALYDGGSAKSPSGSVLALNSRYLTRDGKPWLPVVGEFHYTRYPESRW